MRGLERRLKTLSALKVKPLSAARNERRKQLSFNSNPTMPHEPETTCRQRMGQQNAGGAQNRQHPAAALAQIKATTSSKDLRQLHAALEKAQLLKQLAAVDTAISDQLQALASPRLSRSP
jgi:hypothetical protein